MRGRARRRLDVRQLHGSRGRPVEVVRAAVRFPVGTLGLLGLELTEFLWLSLCHDSSHPRTISRNTRPVSSGGDGQAGWGRSWLQSYHDVPAEPSWCRRRAVVCDTQAQSDQRIADSRDVMRQFRRPIQVRHEECSYGKESDSGVTCVSRVADSRLLDRNFVRCRKAQRCNVVPVP
jgi:hypothetical protein